MKTTGVILSIIGILIFIGGTIIVGLLSEQYWIIPLLLVILGIAVFFVYREIRKWRYF